jgi:hypothetical protein
MESGEGTFFHQAVGAALRRRTGYSDSAKVGQPPFGLSGIQQRELLALAEGSYKRDSLGNSGSNMKAICFLKLTALTGCAALGLLAIETAHAQAPSGPITAAPTQPAPAGTPNGAIPAHAPTPRTTILGAWKFNPDDSDDPGKRTQDSEDSDGGHGGGHGRMGGGYPGGGHGGYGGRRGGGESDEQRQKMHDLFAPAKSIALSMTGAEVDLVDDRNRKRAFITDGRKLQKSKDENYQEIAAKWEGNRLVSEEKDPRGNKMSRTFELSSDGLQLYETLHVTSGRSNTPHAIRYVYDIPAPPAAQAKQ